MNVNMSQSIELALCHCASQEIFRYQSLLMKRSHSTLVTGKVHEAKCMLAAAGKYSGGGGGGGGGSLSVSLSHTL